MTKDEQIQNQPTYRVSALRNGTVIDHLEPGTALAAFHVLGVPSNAIVAIGMNLNSGKIGTKDIIKIDSHELSPNEVSMIALLGPNVTISIIRNYEVVDKVEVSLPEVIEGVARCPNPSCVTNSDAIATRFDVRTTDPIRLRCHYCERLLRGDELELGPATQPVRTIEDPSG